METIANKNTATLLQLSALTQYFFPLGNFIFPALIWSLKKNDSEFIDYNGKQAINFQLSLFLYSFLLIVIAAPIFIYTLFSGMSVNVSTNEDWIVEHLSMGKITGLVLIAIIACCLVIGLKIAELFLILYASVKSNNGERYDFPLTIKFIK
ncbi:DUF4870 domain-containing protein [Flavobacterium sp. NRK1]|uniref:DUF4870 domain-containing protein n=1 Tax=Flavobacterium sp. NRK1 TaxID=2954929 RepID=UPI00209345C6|nr:DUF4870 domain-containing protein [Flavobacterium sp. NRK1]MCO6146777.1 DUF4870 domain-containing protein [Flavobacterium sp. NRK1]